VSAASPLSAPGGGEGRGEVGGCTATGWEGLMLALGSLAFASPWLLAALAALPVIWWLLRVTPPAPRRIAFPAIRLLLGLTPHEGDAGPHPVVADPVAHRARRAGGRRAGPSGAEPAEPACRHRAGGARHRRWLGRGARLEPAPGDGDRYSGGSRTRGTARSSWSRPRRSPRTSQRKRCSRCVPPMPGRRCRPCSRNPGRPTGRPR